MSKNSYSCPNINVQEQLGSEDEGTEETKHRSFHSLPLVGIVPSTTLFDLISTDSKNECPSISGENVDVPVKKVRALKKLETKSGQSVQGWEECVTERKEKGRERKEKDGERRRKMADTLKDNVPCVVGFPLMFSALFFSYI